MIDKTNQHDFFKFYIWKHKNRQFCVSFKDFNDFSKFQLNR